MERGGRNGHITKGRREKALGGDKTLRRPEYCEGREPHSI